MYLRKSITIDKIADWNKSVMNFQKRRFFKNKNWQFPLDVSKMALNFLRPFFSNRLTNKWFNCRLSFKSICKRKGNWKYILYFVSRWYGGQMLQISGPRGANCLYSHWMDSCSLYARRLSGLWWKFPSFAQYTASTKVSFSNFPCFF